MIFRILMLAGLAAIGWLVFLRRNRMPIHIVVVFALLALGGLAVIFAEHTDVIANAVGVGTGADLVTYVFEVAAAFVLIHYYTKFVELQKQVTDLTREIAILRSETEQLAATRADVERETKPRSDS